MSLRVPPARTSEGHVQSGEKCHELPSDTILVWAGSSGARPEALADQPQGGSSAGLLVGGWGGATRSPAGPPRPVLRPLSAGRRTFLAEEHTLIETELTLFVPLGAAGRVTDSVAGPPHEGTGCFPLDDVVGKALGF